MSIIQLPEDHQYMTHRFKFKNQSSFILLFHFFSLMLQENSVYGTKKTKTKTRLCEINFFFTPTGIEKELLLSKTICVIAMTAKE